MKRKYLFSLLAFMLLGLKTGTFAQQGPLIKVTAVVDKKNFSWTQHITVKDDDGIRSVEYMEPFGTWVPLNVNGTCPKIQTWPITTKLNRIQYIRAEDCDLHYITDTINKDGYESLWFYDDIYGSSEETPIYVEWMGSRKKLSTEIISVDVVEGQITDENGNTLGPEDFTPTAGNSKRGYVARVKGRGKIEIIMDPAGDLNIFEYNIYPASSSKKSDMLNYLIGALGGIILLSIFLLLIKKLKSK